MNLKEQIQNFIPFNEQEEKDKESYLKFIDTFEDVLTRENIFGHFSASALVLILIIILISMSSSKRKMKKVGGRYALTEKQYTRTSG